MTERPTAIDWQIDSHGNGHMVNLDLQLPGDQRVRVRLHVHLTDRVPARDLKAQCLRQALGHIQGILQAAEQG